MQKEHAGLSLIVAFAVAAVAIWATIPSYIRQAPAISEATITPDELQQRIDIKSLPVQEIADLI